MNRRNCGMLLVAFAFSQFTLVGCDPRQAAHPVSSDDSQPQHILSAPPLSVVPLQYSPVSSLMAQKPKRKAFQPGAPDPVVLKPTDIATMEILDVKDLLKRAQELNHSTVRVRARVVESQDDYWLLYDGSTMSYVSDRRPAATPGFDGIQSDGPAMVKVSPHATNITLNDQAEVVGKYDAATNTIRASNTKVIFTGLEQ